MIIFIIGKLGLLWLGIHVGKQVSVLFYFQIILYVVEVTNPEFYF